MERMTKREFLAGNNVAFVSDEDCFDVWSVPKKFMGNAIERLASIEDILGDTYDINRMRELVEADKDGRCIILPQKTFELTWDAGPNCNMICPIAIDGEGQCDFCDYGELFVYERKCKQDHIEQIGKTVFFTRESAEDALAKEKQDGQKESSKD